MTDSVFSSSIDLTEVIDSVEFLSTKPEHNPLVYDFTVKDTKGNVYREYQLSRSWAHEPTTTIEVLQSLMDKAAKDVPYCGNQDNIMELRTNGSNKVEWKELHKGENQFSPGAK